MNGYHMKLDLVWVLVVLIFIFVVWDNIIEGARNKKINSRLDNIDNYMVSNNRTTFTIMNGIASGIDSLLLLGDRLEAEHNSIARKLNGGK